MNDDGELSPGWYDELESLIGQSAGHIVFADLQGETHLTQAVVDAAEAMWQRLRSPWTLVEIWNNGTTVWRSPDGDQTVTVAPGGEIEPDFQ